jgi:hypothetical protein
LLELPSVPSNYEKNPVASAAIASMQCYKPYETCQPKSKDNSLVHKVAEIASRAMQGSHQGHPSGYATADTQLYGQSHAYYPDQTMSKTQTEYYVRTPTHRPEYTMPQIQTEYYVRTTPTHRPEYTMPHIQTQYYSETDGYYEHHEMNHGHTGHHPSNGTAYHGKTEKKMKEKHEGKKKEKNLHRKKSKDCKRSGSDSSGSDSE